MKFASATSPLRKFSDALSPNNLANRLVEGGYRVGGAGGATAVGTIGAIASTAGAIAAVRELNPVETVRQMAHDLGQTQSSAGKAGVILFGAGEVVAECAIPLTMGSLIFEFADATAQAWDKPASRITLDK